MKKILTSLLALFTLISVVACTGLATTTTASPVADAFATAEDVVGFEAISATELLAQIVNPVTDIAMPLSYSLLDEPTTTEPIDEEEPIVSDELDVLDDYLAMIEQFLGNTNGLSVTVATSDNLDYEYMMTYVTKNLLGEDVTYTLYYTAVLYEAPVDEEDDLTTTTTDTEAVTTTDTETTETTTETETTTTEPLSLKDQDQDRLRDRDFEFDDENDDSVQYALSGMLVIGDQIFYLEGKKIVDNDEEIMMLRSYIDHDNFVKVRYQTEEGQKKFFYEVKVDGQIVSKTKVLVQTEENVVKVNLTFVEGEANGRYQFTLETEETVTYIKVRYAVEDADGVEESGSIHIVATYDEITGLTTYTYTIMPEMRGNHSIAGEQHEYHTEHSHHNGSDKNDDHGNNNNNTGGMGQVNN
ncbi:MAG: hypothetical protein V1761_03450 [bacterium]